MRIAVVTLALAFWPFTSIEAQTSLEHQQAPRVASGPAPLTENEIRSKRDEVATDLSAAVAELGRVQESDPETSSKTPVSQEVDLLKQIDAILARQQSAESKKDQLTQRILEIQTEIGQLNNSEGIGTGPISFVAFDQLQNELESSRTRLKSIEATVAAAAEQLSNARSVKENKDSVLRLAKEALATNREKNKQSELESAAKNAELNATLANESLSLGRMNSENEDLNKQVVLDSIQLLEAKTKLLIDKVQFSDSDLQEILVQIERQESDVRQSVRMAESRFQYAERELSDARRTLENKGETPQTKEVLAARRVARQLCQQQFDVINLRLGRLSNSREIWDRLTNRKPTRIFVGKRPKSCQHRCDASTAWRFTSRDRRGYRTLDDR